MKKIGILLLGTLLLLTSCAPSSKDEEVVKQDEQAEQDKSIVPSYKLAKDNYRMILPYRPSKARGAITNQIANRLDIDEVEEGLRRLSSAHFDPEKYYFEEGQYLSQDTIFEIIDELNPKIKKDQDEKVYRKNPRYLSHVLEQNFLRKKENNSVELVGVSIALAMKSVYRFQTETGGPYYYEKISKKEMLAEGEKMAAEILKRIRKVEGLENVPIMIALYREEEQGSPVPGNFVAETMVEKGSSKIGKWDSINEEYVLFPSDHAKDKYFEDAQLVNSFGDEIAEYFPNYVGVIGEGFYYNKELKKLTLEIPIEFYGKGEIIGFTQYAFGLVKEMFPDYYDLEINIVSSDKMESFIFREAGQKEPTVHIFH
ncbi:CamS family sex pheromone protein [Ornithinibacillus gellani]|uniref:CamS family sex pheromone protein n=1 Tax=Ornithinibacillus gellani TaxID=2293253 RepID=UPI000F4ACEAB|nr:CamS family sex pheromone protein [Ornithinibacillus gellani]TQS71912.1 CamS family sex pheromone protein [Ornithinibacillus gellani]